MGSHSLLELSAGTDDRFGMMDGRSETVNMYPASNFDGQSSGNFMRQSNPKPFTLKN